ncbi:hypothetical protein T190115A13A_280005 [Tenacibaculum sp. 190524A02b]|uniref:Uncharacterized protein n=1 Tax=Tenacibaculum vairaonense TaxID=3137860 RepID=A0ABP1F8M3_9FLAO
MYVRVNTEFLSKKNIKKILVFYNLKNFKTVYQNNKLNLIY